MHVCVCASRMIIKAPQVMSCGPVVGFMKIKRCKADRRPARAHAHAFTCAREVFVSHAVRACATATRSITIRAPALSHCDDLPALTLKVGGRREIKLTSSVIFQITPPPPLQGSPVYPGRGFGHLASREGGSLLGQTDILTFGFIRSSL